MPDFSTVTELAGDDVSQEQVERICHRYYWAGGYCTGKDVLEVACGSGQGLGYLAGKAKSMAAGDYEGKILSIANAHYGDRFELKQFDAQSMPYADSSKDIIILFEALYYIPSASKFATECRRILRPGGKVLIANANKDLYDFNPSPYTHEYHGVVELERLFAAQGFTVECFGHLPIGEVSLRQKVLRPVKKLAVTLGLMPKTAEGKKFLKRLVFGGLVKMPAEVTEGMFPYEEPPRLAPCVPDKEHKVIYCAATLSQK
ncbi:MAG: class I SAM-dependent methyltransferase [Sporomusaceae bacterium]|nr:class I SAM-dependent methyltransferase [Sporomusaceae bacterium]